MNRHEFRKSIALTPKVDIHFIKIDFDDLNSTKDVMKLLRTNYKALGHPFGFKAKYSGLLKTETGYCMTAYVNMSHFKYMRLCALSDSTTLQNACLNWLQANSPDMLETYARLVAQYKYIKAININNKRKRDQDEDNQ